MKKKFIKVLEIRVHRIPNQKLRLSSFKLAIVNWEWLKTKKEEGICKFCDKWSWRGVEISSSMLKL